jgi:hypothetical protein
MPAPHAIVNDTVAQRGQHQAIPRKVPYCLLLLFFSVFLLRSQIRRGGRYTTPPLAFGVMDENQNNDNDNDNDNNGASTRRNIESISKFAISK